MAGGTGIAPLRGMILEAIHAGYQGSLALVYSARTPGEFAAAVKELGEWYAQGKLKPHVSSQYPLAQAAAALSELAARKAKGNVVIVP